jgi:hypothetical protein
MNSVGPLFDPWPCWLGLGQWHKRPRRARIAWRTRCAFWVVTAPRADVAAGGSPVDEVRRVQRH